MSKLIETDDIRYQVRVYELGMGVTFEMLNNKEKEQLYSSLRYTSEFEEKEYVKRIEELENSLKSIYELCEAKDEITNIIIKAIGCTSCGKLNCECVYD